jgi:hypothetical protein
MAPGTDLGVRAKERSFVTLISGIDFQRDTH